MMPLLRTKYGIAGIVLVVLLLANIISYFVRNWGLITVKVHDVPIGQVIRSIERQGWVTIYSNIDPQTRISMYVDHVPLPEAMETLAVNADAQWRLGFFVAPTSSQVKAEIRSFTEDADRTDDTRIYSFMTPLGFLTGDGDAAPVADPRGQTWPGMPAVQPVAAAAPATTNAADASSALPPSAGAQAVEGPPQSVQGYLRVFAERADIWIMTPAAWDPPVSSAPPPESSITSAIDRFIGHSHGNVTHALILRGRERRVAGGDGGQRRGGGGGGGFSMDFSSMEDRMSNAINGLPAAVRPNALAQLNQEVQFQKEVRLAPPEQRRKMWMQHMGDRRLDADNGWRRSPEKRAQMLSRLVGNRIAAQGK
jgi:hypothetical protein